MVTLCHERLAYSRAESEATATICICDTELPSLVTRTITSGQFLDQHPAFDVDGKYLYFVSARHFANPVADRVDVG